MYWNHAGAEYSTVGKTVVSILTAATVWGCEGKR